MWTHIGGLLACVAAAVSAGIGAWGPSVLALVMWLNKREKSVFVDDHGREALNFGISLLIYSVLTFVAGFPTCTVAWFVGPPILAVLALVGYISGAKHAARGELYRYPMCLRLVQPKA
jgi:uncharacterized protein